MDPVYIKIALGGLTLMVSIGLFFGIGLALAAKKFKVETNPKVEKIIDILPSAQCGACGFPGCDAYAEAVVDDPDVEPNLCLPGGPLVANEIARITGKAVNVVEGMGAVVLCGIRERKDHNKFIYSGYKDCKAANIIFGGPTDCAYGCLGFGDCATACPFHAIEMIKEFPEIDPEKCLGCGLCVTACPKELISLIPKKARIVVNCCAKSLSKETLPICSLGCLHCLACIKACPAQALSLENGKIVIDHTKCINYGSSCNEACLNACFIKYPKFYDMESQNKEYYQRPI
ncbi:MAG: Fe-S cluster domain-containing protein, partial [Desulfobacterales bacterium]|nr:Fe-S cluster domain-containing protein [Desulfobacterales bacterium]